LSRLTPTVYSIYCTIIRDGESDPGAVGGGMGRGDQLLGLFNVKREKTYWKHQSNGWNKEKKKH